MVIVGGALVDLKAYSFMAEELSQRQIDVYLVKSPYELPVLNMNAARNVIKQNHLKNVYLAGHSLGGVVAAQNIVQDTKGLILLASYPAKNTDLSHRSIRVLSLTATNDKVLKWGNWRSARTRLPRTTQYVSIKGGNHAGFGVYGVQKGDGKATISNEAQQESIVRHIDEFITAQ